ncbi:hypothetical protein [Bradyrhizobium neotropicale]|uniref:hypothetical protein n=1 Tax=Bradyrhizobium neotropicale TaxID=1497615 RepID=UPI001AD60A1F|nr:hypothetical protein [Bradyrhizobium neotropicale]
MTSRSCWAIHFRMGAKRKRNRSEPIASLRERLASALLQEPIYEHRHYSHRGTRPIQAEITAKIRPATEADFPFAWKLYSETVGPMMAPHILKSRGEGWDPGIEEKRFSKIWELKKGLIIEITDGPIGWMSVDSEGIRCSN